MSALKGGIFLFLQQLLSRGLTFIASQILLRFMTPEKFGLATQLEVYYLSIIFFARESLRVAVQRQPLANEPAAGQEEKPADRAARSARLAQNTNIAALALPLGLLIAPVLRLMTRHLTSSTTSTTLPLALDMYTTAALLELSSEPFFALLLAHSRFAARALAESAAAIARCLTTLVVAVYAARSQRDAGVLPFACGQLAYAAVLAAVYLARAGWAGMPRRVGGDALAGYFDRGTVRLAASLQAQGVVKHFLTQGDTLIMAVLAGATAQGVYALANNYGGLVARLVFQPVEEMSRNYFGRLLASESVDSMATDAKKADPNGTYPKTAASPPPSADRKLAVQKAAADLHLLLKIYILFSTLVVAVGPAAATPFIQLLAGTRWAADGAGTVLAVYCYYIPLLALNGLTEAFVSAVASARQVHAQSLWMTGFSGVFAAAGWVFLGVWEMQAAGLVYANIVNMACRIVWSAVFIGRFFEGEGVRFDVLGLRPGVVGAVAAVAGPEMVRRVVAMVVSAEANAFERLIVTGAAAVPIVAAVAASEYPFLQSLSTTMQSRKAK
ncbi:hypothetical protein TD95_005005 [Thielaviopsis punctulata]|uniref:Man(5)GlcNAc(2)-PP-dolichol translocation protein RFT1 n=1 Tax=Thielaviopsis punctulata TaxID=72032 RepID=A0A0F4Z9Z4_9PEZI|nr:hypothetical protein TD95_005005 [Thielaviopsis punctulata]